MKLRSLCLALGSTFLLQLSMTSAQDNGLKTVDAKGKLEESSGYQLKIKDKAGKELTIFVDPSISTLNYNGTADAKLLGPGLMVRFTNSFDSKGNPQKDQKELEIFRPKVGVRMMQSELMSQTPGIYPVEGKQDPLADNKNGDRKNGDRKNSGNSASNDPQGNSSSKTSNTKDSKSAKSNAKQRPSKKPNDANATTPKPMGDVQEFKVVGQITNVQGNKLQVNTGSQVLVIQLAADPKIKVSMPDAEYGVKGDEVHVVGMSNASQPDAVQAKILTITGAKPLAPQQIENAKKPTDKGAAGNSTKSDQKKDGKSDNKGSGKPTGKKS